MDDWSFMVLQHHRSYQARLLTCEIELLLEHRLRTHLNPQPLLHKSSVLTTGQHWPFTESLNIFLKFTTHYLLTNSRHKDGYKNWPNLYQYIDGRTWQWLGDNETTKIKSTIVVFIGDLSTMWIFGENSQFHADNCKPKKCNIQHRALCII